MTTLLTAAKAALEALETCDWNDNDFPDDTQYFDRFAVSEAATKLRAAIAEAEKQEPVAEVVQMYGGSGGMVRMLPNTKTPPVGTKLYVGPAALTVPQGWQPIETAPQDLTDVLLGWWETRPENKWKQKVGPAGNWDVGMPGTRFQDGYATHWMSLPAAPKPEDKP